ncbi:acyl-CoA/acyl-ACP dehydrogenase [Rhodococcus sp. HM1]|uniref:acyl-CoA dehydrogenase family protein n=1 Tax=unclassified Rhodococcus (in: high G+C Gram-positive bacteria) TaxID=192944 RepID=UPI0018CE4B5B|nr:MULTISPECIES: acyl-CoA dehydrogenase family protein [unclassified Rhodococcus (in: high G+C Gram-positive bacteria)]MBH0121256.1 acyl-CoA/acyl-ACP dehydrogenase [Rhodococcus sp. CX]MCK8671269.1 acyl-CoA/acyl-ACP dehydrogenase [Rhodococcus sp. HM1]
MTTTVDPMLTDTVVRATAAECDTETVRAWERTGTELPTIWKTFLELGLLGLAVPEDQGGSGGDLADALEVLRLCAAGSVPVPYAEHVVLAGQWLGAAGRYSDVQHEHVVTVVPDPHTMTLTDTPTGTVLEGTVRRVPWARDADQVLIPCRRDDEHVLVLVDSAALDITGRRNLAAEPRDTVTASALAVTDSMVVGPVDPVAWTLAGALVRSVALAGATQRALDLSIDYVKVREQFGRPLGKFQAVGHMLARTAEDTAAARLATESAINSVAGLLAEHSWEQALRAAETDTATAKILTSQAATSVARMAHQMHGAMGTTVEYDLQLSTRRMWSWREEFGSHTFWSRRLGRIAATAGAARLWDLISR